VQSYGVEGAAEGWRFLTGEQSQIERLAAAVGYKYRYDEKSGEYVHPASIMFITPDGRVSRYMNDVLFQPRDVRLALVEASDGAIGSPVEKALLFTCFQYDPESGSYAYSAMKLMRLGGGLTVILLAGVIGLLFWRGSRQNKTHRPALEGAQA
jgi:protein SCO1/2